ncbi:hypothetical protein ACO0M4_11925 [Streptomyces sp. RGM 3693]|uniref:hypothetical protein n=1 Tax=Streptomyces sp. RGM 3693 TaxID=3413284 RepID=UPI003D276731
MTSTYGIKDDMTSHAPHLTHQGISTYMTEYDRGDRVAVLYLSKRNGTCLAYNRSVIDVEAHEEHGQRVWVNMPDDAVLGSPLSFFADDDEGISPMEDEEIEEQTPGKLIANLTWHIEAAAPNSANLVWPSGRRHLPMRVPFTEGARALHARLAAHYIEYLRIVDPRGLRDWATRFKPARAGLS